MRNLKVVAILMVCLGMMGISSYAQERDKKPDRKDNVPTAEKNEKAEELIKSAVESSTVEVQLGQLAQSKNVSKEVQNLGMKMVKHHTEAKRELKEIGKDMNVNVSEEINGDKKNTVDQLADKEGEEFTEEFLDKVIKEQKDYINKLERAKNNVDHGELQAWIDNSLPELKQQLNMAQNIQKNTAQNSQEKGKNKTSRDAGTY